MSQSISFQCPGCQARIKAPLLLCGQRRNCPGCGYCFKVPLASPPRDEGPVLVGDDHSPARPNRWGRW
jgi:hypothetical protein